MGNNLGDSIPKQQQAKIDAYVDFTEFNINYGEYLKKNGLKTTSDDSNDNSSSDTNTSVATTKSKKENVISLERQNSQTSSQSSEWEILGTADDG